MHSQDVALERLTKRLNTVRSDSTRRWGRMTAHQMVCHLTDAFSVAMGEQVVSNDAHLFNRTILKWAALYLPIPWPPGIVTRPELDQVKGRGTQPTDFASDLATAQARMESFWRAGARLEGRPHPLFGPLSQAAWLRWGYLHTDHHLRQFGA
jgi:hypothetical protein